MSGTGLEKQIDQYLARVQISERFKEWAVKYLHELHETDSTSRNDIVEAQQKAYQQCLIQIDNLVKLKTSSGNIDGILLSDAEYGRQRFHLLKEKASLEELLRDIGHRVEQWLDLSEKTFEFACTARSRFAQGDSKTKKEILMAIRSNLILKDRKLSIEARKPFFILENSLSPDEPGIDAIEPEITVRLQRRKDVSVSLNPTWGAIRDDVRTSEHKNKELVKSIYAFFRRDCLSPSFRLSDWKFFFHAESMDEGKKQKKEGGFATNDKFGSLCRRGNADVEVSTQSSFHSVRDAQIVKKSP